MRTDRDTIMDSHEYSNSVRKTFSHLLDSLIAAVAGLIAKKFEFYVYYHILARYYKKSKRTDQIYSNLPQKLSNLNQLTIADLYQTKNELQIYDFRMSDLPYLVHSWCKNVAIYYSNTNNVSIAAVNTVTQLNTSCKIQEMCKVLFISSLVAPDDHDTLNLLLINIKSQLLTTKNDPDEATSLFNACISEMKLQPTIYQEHITKVVEKEAYKPGPTNIQGRIHEESVPLEKPNHMALLYSMQQDVSLQSLLANELILKTSDHVPI